MAAGVGSRINRYIDCPKSALKVGDIPLIERTVKMLIDGGVDVSVVVGHKSEIIEDILEGYNIKFHYNPFFKITNSLASLWFAKESLIGTESVILANADVFWEVDTYNALVSDNHDAVMLSDKSCIKQGDYFFQCDEHNYIIKYGKELKPEERTSEYVGVAKIEGDFVKNFVDRLDAMVRNGQYDYWWENVLYHHIPETPVYTKDISDYFWAEIDYIEDYSRISKYIETGDVSSKYVDYIHAIK